MEETRNQVNRPKPANNKKIKNHSPEIAFQLDLNACSKHGDLKGAIALYEKATSSQNLRLNLQHVNSLLYICSNSVSDPSLKESAVQFGFCVYDRLLSSKIDPNEATITAVARLAAASGEGDRAFALVKSMRDLGVIPRLRTYDPALYWFCNNSEPHKAYEVEKHMAVTGITPEEPELAALLRVSAEAGIEERVYEYLHKLRKCVRSVGEGTAKAIEDWFQGERASEVGNANYDHVLLKDSILKNGGGFHGLGWIGKGKWTVRRGNVDEFGVCGCCGETLACADIDDLETERFADSVASLAMEREAKANFGEFQEWLKEHTHYQAIVDAANISLYQQNFADGGFCVSQLDAVVKELCNRSGGKWPLVVLHNKRLRALQENPTHRRLLEEWVHKGVLYLTPNGSNDDWYWLYAAVKLRCFLVTNDEMRDHIFELIGSEFFLKWKERHQVRYTFTKGCPVLLMPPPFSRVTQESENGSWHVPISDGKNEETAITWLCITRPNCSQAFDGKNGAKSVAVTGKRKERSPSPSHRHSER
ncbi:hypothetical protein SAY87_028642 [Trapa incisa]|uniref:ribonuclease P n=1 Tax=Trapa incisa TaxID=236973 RepID=A0AAN7KPJ3_9MYRT|nr:hypothetical protein SAY87_028642 [Trapa incisa]